MGSNERDRARANTMLDPQALAFDSGDGAPDSWEMADLEESMRKLLAPRREQMPIQHEVGALADALPAADAFDSADSGEVDSFLYEALQGKDRLTILRLEQEVEKFMLNPKLQQLEFLPMPSSYLRLAAHRVVQHYNLQSSVVDCDIPEGTRIIARKTSQSVFPRVKLSEVHSDKQIEIKPAQTLQQRFELKRRPMKGSKFSREMTDPTSKLHPSKSVEVRKEEYNRARARIFSNSNSSGNVKGDDNFVHKGSGMPQSTANGFSLSDKKVEQSFDTLDYTDSYVRSESTSRQKSKNRVAIFRDREKDRKDPDYDRSYDRYMQHFDPGFGMNQGHYGMQAVYAPMVNYNTEFPQLGGSARSSEAPLPQPPLMCGPWTGSSSAVVYGHIDPTVMGSFNINHVGPPMYMHPHQLTCPHPNVMYEHSQDQFSQSLFQLEQLEGHLQLEQLEGSFCQARHQ